MSKKLQEKIKRSIEANPYKDDIAKVSLFGSYLHGRPKKGSDIDLLIEFKPRAQVGLFEMVRIQRHLSNCLKKKIDLVTPEALSKYFRDEVLSSAKKIYEQKR